MRTCPVCTARIYPEGDGCPECGQQIQGRGENFYAPRPISPEPEPQYQLSLLAQRGQEAGA